MPVVRLKDRKLYIRAKHAAIDVCKTLQQLVEDAVRGEVERIEYEMSKRENGKRQDTPNG